VALVRSEKRNGDDSRKKARKCEAHQQFPTWVFDSLTGEFASSDLSKRRKLPKEPEKYRNTHKGEIKGE